MKFPVVITMIAAGLFALAAWQLGKAGLLAGKAWAAPVLIERAWKNGGRAGKMMPPWPWADSYPVARLDLPAKNITRYILAGDSMRNLAFGPVKSESKRATILFGHRDTHFAFLAQLKIGDRLRYQPMGQRAQNWKIVASHILPVQDLSAPATPDPSLMMLITCYPFAKLAGVSDQRYVVLLRPAT